MSISIFIHKLFKKPLFYQARYIGSFDIEYHEYNLKKNFKDSASLKYLTFVSSTKFKHKYIKQVYLIN